MTNQNSGSKSSTTNKGIKHINEGSVKKGGVNRPPVSDPPKQPEGQNKNTDK